ncbi:hypothetical protein [Streptomyces sp. 769]|uniref:hypothetical protein n=1 Tax=Streptomyces sp. 769 TaxID=1262452 RepID=UPI000581D0E8|nr:hypothetical protein [Streptomyces sp. 769]AJC52622.1 hypothetical protein GZL_00014 [Streptomyces sp. 769]AJC61917.1 hypothetical protein GZL_09399 [Streptomyces sp. 769]
MSLKYTTVLGEEGLVQMAAAAGPLAAVTALAAAEDAGVGGHAIVLDRLVQADPAAWTADCCLAAGCLPSPW